MRRDIDGNPDISDEELAQFLDGESDAAEHAEIEAALADDAALRARAANLEGSKVALQDDLAALLRAAPQARLDAILAGALEAAEGRGETLPRRARIDLHPPTHGRAMMAAAAIVIFLVGALLGSLLGVGQSRDGGPENWRRAVAEYWSLTTPATLAIAPDAAATKVQLATAGAALGLDIAPVATEKGGLSFRGSQLYEFRGKPLVQIAFLDPTYGPIAYCIITDPTNSAQPRTDEAIDGFNLVHWAAGGHARLLIGHAPAEVLQRYAATLDG